MASNYAWYPIMMLHVWHIGHLLAAISMCTKMMVPELPGNNCVGQELSVPFSHMHAMCMSSKQYERRHRAMMCTYLEYMHICMTCGMGLPPARSFLQLLRHRYSCILQNLEIIARSTFRDWYVLCNTSIRHEQNPLLPYSDVALRMYKQASLTNHLINTRSDRSFPELLAGCVYPGQHTRSIGG